MLYLVTEFAKNGEIFGKQENIFHVQHFNVNFQSLSIVFILPKDPFYCSMSLSFIFQEVCDNCQFLILELRTLGKTVTVYTSIRKKLKITDVPLAEDIAY